MAAGNIPVIYIKKNSKVKQISEQVTKLLNDEEKSKVKLVSTDCQLTKTVACTEIIKNKFPEIFQQNFLSNASDGKETSGGKTSKMPCLTVILSNKKFNKAPIGYQRNEPFAQYWEREVMKRTSRAIEDSKDQSLIKVFKHD